MGGNKFKNIHLVWLALTVIKKDLNNHEIKVQKQS